MKLKLTNFRCYTNTTFDIPDTGLVLLSGVSGSGKSTLLKAILYAFYGNKAIKKPYSFGTNTCCVEFSFLNLKIKRSNRPNRLIVNDLEDAPAQEYINEILGMSYDEFLVSSYIPQKNNNSVLSLSPTDQIRLIKTLAIEQTERYKEKIQEMIKESGDILLELQTEQKIIKNELDRYVITSAPELPFNDDIEKEIADFWERIRTFADTFSDLNSQRATLEKEIYDNELKEKEKARNNKETRELEKEQQALQSEYDRYSELLEDLPDDLQERIDELQEDIDTLRLSKEIYELEKEFEQISIEEKKDLANKISKLEKELWVDGDVSQEFEKLTAQNEQRKAWDIATQKLAKLVKDPERPLDDIIQEYKTLIDKNNSQINEWEKQLEQIQFEEQILHCPECKASLQLQDNGLVAVDDYQPQDIDQEELQCELSDLKKENNVLERKLLNISRIYRPEKPKPIDKERLSELKEYINDNKLRERQLQELKNNKGESATLKRMSIKIKNKRKQLPQKVPDADINDLEKELLELSKKHDRWEEYNTNFVKIKKNLDNVKNKLTQLKKQKFEILNNKLLQGKISELKTIDNKIKKLTAQQKSDQEIMDDIKAWTTFKEQEKEIARWEKQKIENNEKVLQAEKVHVANLRLKEKYNEAEIKALETTIYSINQHTKHYIDTFFSDHQLIAELQSIHKGKAQSLKINTIVNYKGNEYDNIGQLSGGEFDRCTLASICGINSMLNSPMLVLDESLASLDADTNTEILRFLKELAEEKLILVCSHEAVQGIFDNVIEI